MEPEPNTLTGDSGLCLCLHLSVFCFMTVKNMAVPGDYSLSYKVYTLCCRHVASLTFTLGNRRHSYSPLVGKRREAWESWANYCSLRGWEGF